MTDTDLIQQIKHVFATEQFDSDAVRKVRQILAPPVPNDGLPVYNFETATEAERFAYDQGYEAGWDARLDHKTMSMAAVKDAIAEIVLYFNRIIDDAPACQGDGKCTNPRCPRHSSVDWGTAWDRHDDPEQQP